MISIIYWLATALILVLFELTSPSNFFFLSFSCGALIGALTNWLGCSLFLQSLAAFISTGISFLLLFFWVRKQVHRFSKKEYQSNMYSLVGKSGFIIKEPTLEEFGHVKIGGEIWSCKALHDDELLKPGTEVGVIKVSGAHVIIEHIER